MRVYIKGMKKPRSCDFCPISLPHAEELGCGFDLEHCPITEVPPHGRLIDADALPYLDIEFEDILDAPTVIEADVSEEELQREYEANVEYAQYCERYEPTYDPNTGAM